MTKAELENEFAEASQQVASLRIALYNAQRRRDDAAMAYNRARFSCSCVRRNGDIGLYTTNDLRYTERNHLTGNAVADALSADKECLVCQGTGETNETNRT